MSSRNTIRTINRSQPILPKVIHPLIVLWPAPASNGLMMTGIWEELLPALTKKVKQAMAPPPKQIKVEATAVKCICVACSKGMKCTRQKWRDLMGPPLKQQVTTSALPSQAEELSPSPVPRKPAPKAAVTAAQVIKGLPAPAVLSPEPAIPAGQSSLAFCVKAPLLKTHTHTHTQAKSPC